MMLALWDAKTARVLSTLLIFVAVIAFVHGAHETLTLFLFSILFAYFVDPLVAFLTKPLQGRNKAIAVTALILASVATGLGFVLGPRIAHEGKMLVTSVPTLVDRVASGQYILQLSKNRGWTHGGELQLQQFFLDHRAQIMQYGENLAANLETPLSHLWWLVLIPILSVFFLKDANEMTAGVINLGRNEEQKSFIQGVCNDVNVMLGSYIRAQLILAGLTGVALTTVLTIMRVPFGFFFGPIAGICEFVPVVGPAIACTLIFGVAFLEGYNHLLFLFLFLGTWRTIQDYFNAPRIMGKSLEILPLVEIFVVLAGGEIGGVVGALVAVPLTAILRIVWLRLSTKKDIETPITSNESPVA